MMQLIMLAAPRGQLTADSWCSCRALAVGCAASETQSRYQEALWAVMRAWLGMGGTVSSAHELPRSSFAQVCQAEHVDWACLTALLLSLALHRGLPLSQPARLLLAGCSLLSHSLPLAVCAQGVCVIAMWAGTVWGALLIVALMRATAPSKREQALGRKIERSLAVAVLRERAAAVIANWWRFRRFHEYDHLSPYQSARVSAAQAELQREEEAEKEAPAATAGQGQLAFGQYRRTDRLRRRRLMNTPLGVMKMPLRLQDAFEQREVNRMRSALRSFKHARLHFRHLCAPGGEFEQLLVGLKQQMNILHRETQSSLVVHTDRLAGAVSLRVMLRLMCRETRARGHASEGTRHAKTWC